MEKWILSNPHSYVPAICFTRSIKEEIEQKFRTTNAAINSSDASVRSRAFNSLGDDIIFKIAKEGKDLNIDRGECDLAMNSYLQVLSKANKPNLSRDLCCFIDFIKDAHYTLRLRAVSNSSAAWFDDWPIWHRVAIKNAKDPPKQCLKAGTMDAP
ncbi:hypothetical protein BT69DRAFT_1327669 [Atractiella rhizophila]|nr:hypothetical protein BT69DRAFT_1327669 [Atractiella rhizophila]